MSRPCRRLPLAGSTVKGGGKAGQNSDGVKLGARTPRRAFSGVHNENR